MPRPSRRKLAALPTPASRDDLAQFIADRSGELALLAGRARWPLLTYFLNMARIEAEARAAQEDRTVVPARPQHNERAG